MVERSATDWNTADLNAWETACSIRTERAKAACPDMRADVWEQAGNELMGDPDDTVMNALIDADVLKAALRIVLASEPIRDPNMRYPIDLVPPQYRNCGRDKDMTLILNHLRDSVEAEIERRANEWMDLHE